MLFLAWWRSPSWFFPRGSGGCCGGTEGYSPSRQSIGGLGGCGELLSARSAGLFPFGRRGRGRDSRGGRVWGHAGHCNRRGRHTNNRGFFGISGCSGFIIHWKYKNGILEINSALRSHLPGFSFSGITQYLWGYHKCYLVTAKGFTEHNTGKDSKSVKACEKKKKKEDGSEIDY